jgi:hypothetical protein
MDHGPIDTLELLVQQCDLGVGAAAQVARARLAQIGPS